MPIFMKSFQFTTDKKFIMQQKLFKLNIEPQISNTHYLQ